MGEDCTCVADEGLKTSSDVEVLAWAQQHCAVLVTADRHIKLRKHEQAALLASGVPVIEFDFPQKAALWDTFEFIVKRWPDAKAMLARTVYVVVRARSIKTLEEERRR